MDRELDFFQQLGDRQTPFTGVVEDRNDPARMGRVRVRIFGVHSTDRSEVPTETLPWATPLLPVTMSGLGGVGAAPTGLIEGTWVMGIFRDGFSCQDPVIIGVIQSNSPPKWTGYSNVIQSNISESIARDIQQEASKSLEEIIDELNDSLKNNNELKEKLQKEVSDILKEVLSEKNINTLDDFINHLEDIDGFTKQIDDITDIVSDKVISNLEPEFIKHYNLSELDTGIKNKINQQIQSDVNAKLTNKTVQYQVEKNNEQ
jgi:hypothetical protein